MSIAAPQSVFVVMSNADLTEGRCGDHAYLVCETATTAARLGRGQYVQGSDCPVVEVALTLIDGELWMPLRKVPVKRATTEDLATEHRLAMEAQRAQRHAEAIARAKAAGLSDDDIADIMGQPKMT